MFSKFFGVVFVVVGVIVSGVQCKTDSDDVSALSVMYTSLNSPKTLDWKSSGGDPCGDDWKGITCSGSSVTEIKLSGLKLTGSLGYQLSSLSSVTYFDVSNNDIKGDIPFQLPPNVVHLDLSKNGLIGNVPYSISQMTDLKYLNLGHNQLSGQLIDMFSQLHKLDTLDLSENTLTGNLPQSFSSLSGLSSLYLQNNQFTGPVNALAKLKLDDLNLANNHFSGWIPRELTKINKIDIRGNSWSSGPAPPGMTPSGDISPSGNSSIGRIGGFGGAVIAVIVLGFLLGLFVVIALVARRQTTFSSGFLDESFSQHKSFNSFRSHRYSEASRSSSVKEFKGVNPPDSSTSIDVAGLQSAYSAGLTPAYSGRVNSYRNSELANMNIQRTSVSAETYSLAYLQHATSNFATSRLLGEGSIGRVYKAKCSDGKVLAVKKISSTFFQDPKSETFSEIVACLSRLLQPNIAPLVGHCSEQGHNMLIYEYFRNGSLHEFLHLSDEFSKPLTWNTRVRIALGTARAVEYLHEVCSPPLTHMSIKSSNIVLDIELNPRLLECGLSTLFKQRADRNIGAGYNPPECTKASAHTFKSDVYSFGVVMLELLTGRMPFDSSKPRSEQYLVQWARPQLHDIDALEKMVDPALRGLYPPKSISRFADIVALCVQVEAEFRPPMSEVVQSLVRLVQRSSMNKRGDYLSSSRRTDDYDY